MSARIITAVNAFYAMTSERLYRQAQSAASALAELNRDSGTRFDPLVVAALRDRFVMMRNESLSGLLSKRQ